MVQYVAVGHDRCGTDAAKHDTQNSVRNYCANPDMSVVASVSVELLAAD